MSEKPPEPQKEYPEERRIMSQRGGYVSGQSRRGEIEREESGEWQLTGKGKEDLRTEAEKEEKEREVKEVAPPVEKTAGEKVEKQEEERITEKALALAFAEKGNLERQLKILKHTRDATPEESERMSEKLKEAKDKYSEMLVNWSRQELGQRFSAEQALTIIGAKESALLQKYQESLDNKKDVSRLKKAWRWYVKLPMPVRTALTAGVATGALVTGASFGIGFAAAGLGGGLAWSASRRWIGGLLSASVAALVYKKADKIPFIKRWLEQKNKKYYDQAKEANQKLLQERNENINNLVSQISENNKQAEKKAAKRELVVKGGSGLLAGAITGLLVGGVSKVLEGGWVETPPKVVPPPEAGPSAGVIEKGGNVWKTSKSLFPDTPEGRKAFAKAWGHKGSGAWTLIRGGKLEWLPIKDVDLLQPGSRVVLQRDGSLFVIGKGIGGPGALLNEYIRLGKPAPDWLLEKTKMTGLGAEGPEGPGHWDTSPAKVVQLTPEAAVPLEAPVPPEIIQKVEKGVGLKFMIDKAVEDVKNLTVKEFLAGQSPLMLKARVAPEALTYWDNHSVTAQEELQKFIRVLKPTQGQLGLTVRQFLETATK